MLTSLYCQVGTQRDTIIYSFRQNQVEQLLPIFTCVPKAKTLPFYFKNKCCFSHPASDNFCKALQLIRNQQLAAGAARFRSADADVPKVIRDLSFHWSFLRLKISKGLFHQMYYFTPARIFLQCVAIKNFQKFYRVDVNHFQYLHLFIYLFIYYSILHSALPLGNSGGWNGRLVQLCESESLCWKPLVFPQFGAACAKRPLSWA